MRLVGGGARNQGRVEILSYGLWTPICADGFGPNSAAIVCRQLGYPGGRPVLGEPNSFGLVQVDPEAGTLMVGSDDLCTLDMASLLECGVLVPDPLACDSVALTCPLA